MTAIIGLTGTIGSGKSTVARLLRKCGAKVIDTDAIAHHVYKPESPAWNEILAYFGDTVLDADRTINRTKLGNIVFRNKSALKKLNAIVHPRILELVCTYIRRYNKQNIPVVVIEASLLIEAGWKGLVDEVWVVTAPKQIVAARLKKRSGLNEDDIAERNVARLSERALLKYGKVIIKNDSSREDLRQRVAKAWDNLKENRR